MSELARALVTPLDEKNKPLKDKAFSVQFNPASLRLQTSAQPAGGGQQSSVRKQAATNAKTTLTLELHFDTYDEGTTSNPTPVTKKTALLEQFLKPVQPPGSSKPVPPPPRISFKWGGFEITGIVNQLSVEYDHFHHSGAPLRAKCGLTLESQDPLLAAPVASPTAAGAAPGNVAQPGAAGADGAGAKDPGRGLAEKGALALAGESLAAFAQRNGLDPKAWRELADGVSDVASLPAGLEITYSAQIGQRAADVSGGAADPVRAAQAAVTEAGGPLAAAAAVRDGRNAVAVNRELQAFGAVPSGASGAPTRPNAGAAPQQTARPGVSPPPPASRPFGAGIPLHPRLGGARPDRRPAGWPASPKNRVPGCGCGGT
ncbi:MAG: hypothetical protein ACR652_05225 [Methylocystis sp.]|uniref:CIS tube protein n=1 Tax=Methylocystis sp. TaxID=1911079 RepID=UPI003DA62F18